jgi:hypothetical protein
MTLAGAFSSLLSRLDTESTPSASVACFPRRSTGSNGKPTLNFASTPIDKWLNAHRSTSSAASVFRADAVSYRAGIY